LNSQENSSHFKAIGPNARNLILAGVLPQNPLGEAHNTSAVPILEFWSSSKAREKREKSKRKGERAK